MYLQSEFQTFFPTKCHNGWYHKYALGRIFIVLHQLIDLIIIGMCCIIQGHYLENTTVNCIKHSQVRETNPTCT